VTIDISGLVASLRDERRLRRPPTERLLAGANLHFGSVQAHRLRQTLQRVIAAIIEG